MPRRVPGLRLADAPGETPEDQIVADQIRGRRPRGGLRDGVAAAVVSRAGQVHDVAHRRWGRADAIVALGTLGGNSGRAVQVLDEREVPDASRLKVTVEPPGGERERGTVRAGRRARGTPEVAAVGMFFPHLTPRPADGSIAPCLEDPSDAKRDPANGEDARSRDDADEPGASARLKLPASFDSPALCRRLGHGDDHVRRRVDDLGVRFGRVKAGRVKAGRVRRRHERVSRSRRAQGEDGAVAVEGVGEPPRGASRVVTAASAPEHRRVRRSSRRARRGRPW